MTTPAQKAADLDLVRRVLAGDEACTGEFIERMGCVSRILVAKNAQLGKPLSAEDVSDVVQDTLLAVWGKLEHYDGRAALETWVYRFCHLELLHRLRSLHRRPGSLLDPDARPHEGSDKVEADARDLAHVLECIETLPEPLAQVLLLKHLEDLTFEEVGQRLTLSPNTVKTRYYRGLGKLKGLVRRRTFQSEAELA